MKNIETFRAQESFLGAAIGESLGASFEQKFSAFQRQEINAYLDQNPLNFRPFVDPFADRLTAANTGEPFPAGHPTDDISLALASADSLVKCGGFDSSDQRQRFRDWLFNGKYSPTGRRTGAGRTTFKGISSGDPDPQNQSNGSIMRILPIGLFFAENLEILYKVSRAASALTHPNPVVCECAAIYNFFVASVVGGRSFSQSFEAGQKFFASQIEKHEEIKTLLEADYMEMPFEILSPTLRAIDSLQIVFWAWNKSESFADGIEKVIRIGGDTDTYATLLGGILGAAFAGEKGKNIPFEWRKNLLLKTEISNAVSQIIAPAKDWTAAEVLAQPEWADAPNPAEIDFSTRKSFCGEIQLDSQNRPINPVEAEKLWNRTGRGHLGKWGPNMAADPIVTRINPQNNDLEILLVLRAKDREWALPGGMKDSGETDIQTARREMREEAGLEINFSASEILYQGYVFDPRNTRNAWCETSVVHRHLGVSNPKFKKILTPNEVADRQWFSLSSLPETYASHSEFIKLAVSNLGKNF